MVAKGFHTWLSKSAASLAAITMLHFSAQVGQGLVHVLQLSQLLAGVSDHAVQHKTATWQQDKV